MNHMLEKFGMMGCKLRLTSLLVRILLFSSDKPKSDKENK